MIWFSRILTFLLGFFSLWGVVFLVVTTYGWEKVWYSIHGPADLGSVQFSNLSKISGRDQILICPDLICDETHRDQISPLYATDALTLRTAFIKILEQEPSLVRVDNNSDPLRLRYVQRSRLLRRPDTISVRFYNFDSGTNASLALYSRSHVAIPYLMENSKRAQRWLKRLKDLEENPI